MNPVLRRRHFAEKRSDRQTMRTKFALQREKLELHFVREPDVVIGRLKFLHVFIDGVQFGRKIACHVCHPAIAFAVSEGDGTTP